MLNLQKKSSLSNCEEKLMNQFMGNIGKTYKKIKEFNSFFSEFVEDQKKLSKELWNCSTRYNILNAGTPCVYAMVQKDELLQDILVQIQDKSATISQALCAVKLDYENLFRLQKVLEEDAHSLNWDSSINPFIKSNIKHQPPAQYLEEIADILFQLDVLISSMFQYHEALILHDSKSFENFMNSFNISNEVVELLKAFAINSATLLN